MSRNRYRPHIHILPEDDANRQIARGFELHGAVEQGRIQVLPEAGGWTRVLEEFETAHRHALRRFPLRTLILLIDFDNSEDRRAIVESKIPDDLRPRVFILGARSEPEDLRAQIGPFETIGTLLAQECHDGTDQLWGHALLRHNAEELARLREPVRAILFNG